MAVAAFTTAFAPGFAIGDEVEVVASDLVLADSAVTACAVADATVTACAVSDSAVPGGGVCAVSEAALTACTAADSALTACAVDDLEAAA